VTIRPATPADLPLIARLVREFAEQEKLSDQLVATEADLRSGMFGPSPGIYGLIIEAESGEPARYATYFYNFSTFLGRRGIHVEDVFLRPAFRDKGLGRAIFQYLARKAAAEDCGRMEWWVLEWNERAIRFYRSLGAQAVNDWRLQRLTGDALRQFAES
jgi:diamine N-acetyltransferase